LRKLINLHALSA